MERAAFQFLKGDYRKDERDFLSGSVVIGEGVTKLKRVVCKPAFIYEVNLANRTARKSN